MKKRIANGIELFFILAAYIMLWIPNVTIYAPHELNQVDVVSIFSILSEDGMCFYPAFYSAFFAVNAILCIISIIVKPEHKDGKTHVIMAIFLFLFASTFGYEPSIKGIWNEILTEEIVATSFPCALYLFCLVAIVVISIAKRSTIITGIPSKKEKTVINNIQETSNADELKKYKDLLESGAITQEEFDAKKKQLLGL